MPETAVAAALTVLLLLQDAKDPQSGLHDSELTRFLTLAVFEGLFEDGAEADVVKSVAADNRELFIPKCPLCHPVKHGFEIYAAAPPPDLYESRGKGLPKKVLEQLRSRELPARKKGLEALVQLYVERRFERLALPEAEKKRLRRKIEEGRKKGMSFASLAAGDFCPSCEGAAKAGN